MDFLIVTDVFSKYFLVRKLANSTSAAVCAELATIVTELGLTHIIRSDNGPCYNSKEFQQLLQHYNITHHTSSPHHPRSNGFVKRMVGVVKKLMDKGGKEGKPWISGLYEYRVTPQSSSIASPLQLITQCTPREKDLPQLLSTLGAQEMYQTHQELIRRQQTSSTVGSLPIVLVPLVYLAVALPASSFLSFCLIVTAVTSGDSSLMIFEMKVWSFRPNRKMSRCRTDWLLKIL